jgi:hypothetical protein
MLCKIWRFHGGDYEECRLLGYKNTVRTSQETHYVSATETSQLMQCKIWGFHGGDYEEWRLLGYINSVRTSQETHYVSAKETSQLMLCKIWGFHGGHYDECCFLGYKNPIRTSQETHYVSATESSQLMLCKIWGFHGGDYGLWHRVTDSSQIQCVGILFVEALVESSHNWRQPLKYTRDYCGISAWILIIAKSSHKKKSTLLFLDRYIWNSHNMRPYLY